MNNEQFEFVVWLLAGGFTLATAITSASVYLVTRGVTNKQQILSLDKKVKLNYLNTEKNIDELRNKQNSIISDMKRHNKEFITREELQLVLGVMISCNGCSKTKKNDLDLAFKSIRKRID